MDFSVALKLLGELNIHHATFERVSAPHRIGIFDAIQSFFFSPNLSALVKRR